MVLWAISENKAAKRLGPLLAKVEAEAARSADAARLLRHIREFCTESIALGETLQTPQAKSFARSIGWKLISVEFMLGGTIPGVPTYQAMIGGPLDENDVYTKFDPDFDDVCTDHSGCSDDPSIVRWADRAGVISRYHRTRKDGRKPRCQDKPAG